jgi:hypothetical protein
MIVISLVDLVDTPDRPAWRWGQSSRRRVLSDYKTTDSIQEVSNVNLNI